MRARVGSTRFRRVGSAAAIAIMAGLAPASGRAAGPVSKVADIDNFAGWYTDAQNPVSDPGEWVPERATLPFEHISIYDPFLPSQRAAGDPTSSLSVITHATPANLTSGDSTAFQYAAWQSLRRDFPDSVSIPIASDDTLLAARWTLSADPATTLAAESDRAAVAVQAPDVRLRLGEASPYGNAQAMDVFVHNGANAITESERIVTTWYHAPRGGNYVTGDYDGLPVTPADPPVVAGFYFDIVDLYSASANGLLEHPGGHRDYGITVKRLEVFAMPADSLAGENIILNTGASTLQTSDGTVPPPDSVPFDPAIWQGRPLPTGAARTTTLPPEDEFGSTDRLAFEMSAGNGDMGAVIDAFEFNVAGGGQSPHDICLVGNDRLVRIDAWLSTDVPAGDPMPGLFDAITGGRSFARVGYFAEFFGPTANIAPDKLYSQGRAGFLDFDMSTNVELDVFFEIEPVYGLTDRSRRVSYFFEPNLATDDALGFRPFVGIYAFDGAGNDALDLMEGTIFIDRIVVTTYDRPDLSLASTR